MRRLFPRPSVAELPLDRILADAPPSFPDDRLTARAEQIRAAGLAEPLVVTRDGSRYRLVLGALSLTAARIAGLTRAPCVILRNADSERGAWARLSLPLGGDATMFDEAEAFSTLRERGYTQEAIAEQLGCSPSCVANKLRLLRLSPECRELILSVGLSERHARAALRIADEDARFAALAHMAADRLTVAAADRYVDALIAGGSVSRETS